MSFKMRITIVLLASVIICAIESAAEPTACEPTTQKASDPSFAAVQDDPTLPRVLLIGDSISMGYTLPVRRKLAGKYNVHRPPANCGNTARGLKQLDEWIGEGKWDVIHFNFG